MCFVRSFVCVCLLGKIFLYHYLAPIHPSIHLIGIVHCVVFQYDSKISFLFFCTDDLHPKKLDEETLFTPESDCNVQQNYDCSSNSPAWPSSSAEA